MAERDVWRELVDIIRRTYEPCQSAAELPGTTIYLSEYAYTPRMDTWRPRPRYARRRSLRDAVKRTVARGRA